MKEIQTQCKKKITLENNSALFTEVGGMHIQQANDFPSRDLYIHMYECTQTRNSYAEVCTQECLVYVSNVLLNSITRGKLKLETIQILSGAEGINWNSVKEWNVEQQ